MENPYLSIIIPAYNEAERIPQTLVDVNERLADADFTYEILVVDDGSQDGTASAVSRMADAIKNLSVVDTRRNAGKGAAVRRGMLMARGQVRLFMDADNSTAIDQFNRMMPYLSNGSGKGYGVVIGSRAAKGAKLEPPEPLYRRAAGRGLNAFVQILLLPGIRDTQCGFKAFTAEAANRIFKLSRINGWGFDVEILSIARLLGYRIKEVPVRWANDTRSHVRATAGLQFVRDVLKVRWRIASGRFGI